MIRNGTILIALFFSIATYGQVAFKTIVPQSSVVVGESFQVQFTIEDDEEITNLKPPPFSNFRIVTGPHIYYGSVSTRHGIKPLKNTVYTLVATRPGQFVIPGATANSYGEIVHSNDVLVEVISKEEAIKRFNRETGSSGSDFFLRPGEDGYEKIKQNLFLKVMVDKKNCYVGEPVLATFKLYSRLESRSDIVKNPGFYGFTVYDMVSLSDRLVTSELVNGRTFDVHTIRKVQLYPLQAGDYSIDPMEVRNKVEFSRSAVNKKTEQEIVEGVLGFDEDEVKAGEDTEVFETEMHTAPVVVHVKPIPAKDRPADYNGAVGAYTIRAAALQDMLGLNEKGIFEVTIRGKGNFTQLDAPVVNWPAGIEGFAPVVKDMLDRTTVPLAGQRVFRFVFVAARPGVYTIPGISFSFYDPDSGRYKSISTRTVDVRISSAAKKKMPGTNVELNSTGSKNKMVGLLAGIILAAGITGIFLLLKKRKAKTVIPETNEGKGPSPEIILAPAYEQLTGHDKHFYSALHQSIWNFFSSRFAISGSDMNKNNLLTRMQETGMNSEWVEEVMVILQLCESGMFTDAQLLPDKDDLLKRTRNVLEKLNAGSF